MPLVYAKCSKCNSVIQVDDTAKSSYCSYCGCRLVTNEAVHKFLEENGNSTADVGETAKEENKTQENNNDIFTHEHKMNEAFECMSNRSFSQAERLFSEILNSDSGEDLAKWGLILAKTRNLEPAILSEPDDFLWTYAQELFDQSRNENVGLWRSDYEDAFYKACVFTADSVDARVFIETEIFRWNNTENHFEYRLNKTYDINWILDRKLRGPLNRLCEALPLKRRFEFEDIIGVICNAICDYFEKGFQELENIRQGNISKLLGWWIIKRNGGENNMDVVRFSLNSVNVLHCEFSKLAFNRYDFFRFVKLDSSDAFTCRESWHFPSAVGAGGDYCAYNSPHVFLPIFALYDFLLILPDAVFIKANYKSIPNIDRAIMFQKKCHVSTSFFRSGNKSNVQMRPISDSVETADFTRRVHACYIATAVFGDADARQVNTLRKFRDEYLLKTSTGRHFADWYYRNSPVWAGRLKKTKIINAIVRKLLNALVYLLHHILPD